MNGLIDRYCRLLDGLMVGGLALMVLMVFGNVVLRYAFNSGITVSEEVSRWIFVWISFLGAIVAMKEHGHLGVDALVRRLSPTGQRLCLVVGQVLMLGVCALLFQGSLAQVRINMEVAAPTTGAPMAIFYASGLVFSVSAAVFLLRDLFRAVTGRLRDDELVMVKESEEQAELEALQRELAEQDRLQAVAVGRPAVAARH